MPPDLNSLPPSPSPTTSPLPSRMASTTPSDPSRVLSQSPAASHTPPHSLAAAAALNAGIQNEESRRSSGGNTMRREVDRARRRSSVRMNINLNDPTVPAPGEMQPSHSPSMRPRNAWPHSPHHERTPSIGELHQELEAEQELQVNRLLNLIRHQQAQISTLQSLTAHLPNTSAIDDSTPTSERSNSMSFPPIPSGPTSQPSLSPLPPAAAAMPIPISAGSHANPRSHSPYGTPSRHSSLADRSRSRASSRSRHGSPAIRPMEGGAEWLPPPAPASTLARDETSFYQAETQNLTRENQMLKLRIRELERQLAEQNPTAAISHSPVMPSSLASPAASAARPPPSQAQASSSNTASTPHAAGDTSATSTPPVI